MTAVYEIRAFRNSDPPHLAELWRSQPAQRGMFQAVSTMLLEQHIFSKPYFDPNGLLVGTYDGVPVGFAHAGFGPNDEQSHLCKEMGTTYMLLVQSEHRESELPRQLLIASEEYLRKQGAKVLYAGGINPLNAFYLGLYGGSELPGVLTSDPMLDDAIRGSGYSEVDRVIVLQRSISSFRPEVSRKLRQLKREVTVEQQYCPPHRKLVGGLHTGQLRAFAFRFVFTFNQRINRKGLVLGHGAVGNQLAKHNRRYRRFVCSRISSAQRLCEHVAFRSLQGLANTRHITARSSGDAIQRRGTFFLRANGVRADRPRLRFSQRFS